MVQFLKNMGFTP